MQSFRRIVIVYCNLTPILEQSLYEMGLEKRTEQCSAYLLMDSNSLWTGRGNGEAQLLILR